MWAKINGFFKSKYWPFKKPAKTIKQSNIDQEASYALFVTGRKKKREMLLVKYFIEEPEWFSASNDNKKLEELQKNFELLERDYKSFNKKKFQSFVDSQLRR